MRTGWSRTAIAAPLRLWPLWHSRGYSKPAQKVCRGLPGSLDNPRRIIRIDRAQSGSSSVVEHRLAKARVASSSLVSRSTTLDEGGRMKDESLGAFEQLLHLLAFHALCSP